MVVGDWLDVSNPDSGRGGGVGGRRTRELLTFEEGSET